MQGKYRPFSHQVSARDPRGHDRGHSLKATTADPFEGCQNCQREGRQVSLPEVFKNKSLA